MSQGKKTIIARARDGIYWIEIENHQAVELGCARYPDVALRKSSWQLRIEGGEMKYVVDYEYEYKFRDLVGKEFVKLLICNINKTIQRIEEIERRIKAAKNPLRKKILMMKRNNMIARACQSVRYTLTGSDEDIIG